MRRVSSFLGTHYMIQTALVGAVGILVSGCSLDTARFKNNPFGDPFTTGSVNRSPEQPNQDPSNWNSRPAAQPRPPVAAPNQPVVTVGQGGWTAIGGTQIIANDADTLPAISHRYGVPERAIMSANGLSSANISSGQTLIIPIYDAAGNSKSHNSVAAAPNTRSETTTAYRNTNETTQRSLPTESVPMPVARPAFKETSVKNNTGNVPTTNTNLNLQKQPPQLPVKSQQDIQVASISASSSEVSSGATSRLISEQGNYFRWPAKGRVIAGFGTAGNEGINIALPEGAAVRSVETGTVTYVGDEIKNFGHLVVVRHDNGYVSAYAHNRELSVKRGERVSRGQVIAKSGRSGNVTSPQLHFELRKGGTPIDPIPRLTGS